MPWVIYDPKERDYLCMEQSDQGGELWDHDRAKATRFLTEEEAQLAFDEIDVEEWLTHIGPLYIEDKPPPPKKPWEEMTFAERMAQVEEDFEATVAERLQRKMLAVKPSTETVTGRTSCNEPNVQHVPIRKPSRLLYEQIREMVKDKNIKIVSQVHDEVLVEVEDRRPGQENVDFDLTRTLLGLDKLQPPKPIDYAELEMRVLKARDAQVPQREGNTSDGPCSRERLRDDD